MSSSYTKLMSMPELVESNRTIKSLKKNSLSKKRLSNQESNTMTERSKLVPSLSNFHTNKYRITHETNKQI